MNVGSDRKPNEERPDVGIVAYQVDSHGQTLHDLNEVAGGVFGWQQGQRRSSSHRKAGNSSSKALLAPVHVYVQINGLPDTQLGELSLLEVRIDPNISQRTQCH